MTSLKDRLLVHETRSSFQRPVVSIIIPTYNRSVHLSRALASLADLDYPTDLFEVLVIDDGSTDETPAVVRRHLLSASYRLCYLRINHQGIPSARNTGWQRSNGTICLFTDDDCMFPREWLNRLLPYFSSQRVGAIGGPDKGPSDQSPFARCADYAMNSFWGTGGVRKKAGTRLARYYPRGCNMAVPRYVLLLTGGFDNSLAAGEEIDLGCRISKLGFLLGYAPEAFVWHSRRDTILSYARQILTRGRTRVALMRRHNELIEPAYLLPALVLFLSPFFLAALKHLGLWLQALLFFLPCLLSFIVGVGLHAWFKLGITRAIWLAPALILLQQILYGIGTLQALFRSDPGSR